MRKSVTPPPPPQLPASRPRSSIAASPYPFIIDMMNDTESEKQRKNEAASKIAGLYKIKQARKIKEERKHEKCEKNKPANNNNNSKRHENKGHDNNYNEEDFDFRNMLTMKSHNESAPTNTAKSTESSRTMLSNSPPPPPPPPAATSPLGAKKFSTYGGIPTGIAKNMAGM